MVEKADLPVYPLKQVLDVKMKRVETAEAVVKEKKKALEVEQEKLKQRQIERDKVLDHYKSKLTQLRQELDDKGGTTSAKIEQLKRYIQVVKDKLQVEEKKVNEQKKQVEVAEKNLEIAKNQLKARQKEQDKIETHKAEWEKTTLKELEIEEVRKEDDLGSTMFLSKFVQRKSR